MDGALPLNKLADTSKYKYAAHNQKCDINEATHDFNWYLIQIMQDPKRNNADVHQRYNANNCCRKSDVCYDE